MLVLMSGALGSIGQAGASLATEQRAVELLEREPRGPELAAAYTAVASGYMLARDRDTAAAWGSEGDRTGATARRPVRPGESVDPNGDRRRDGRPVRRARRGSGKGSRSANGTVCPASSRLVSCQIGSGCGELRRYEEAVPALIEAVAVCEQHHLEFNRRYVVAWLARCRFDLGQWDEAEAAARDASGVAERRHRPFRRAEHARLAAGQAG